MHLEDARDVGMTPLSKRENKLTETNWPATFQFVSVDLFCSDCFSDYLFVLFCVFTCFVCAVV